MKKLLFLVVAIVATVFSANAQIKVESPHVDLDIEVKRCAYASGTVIIDMIITSLGLEEELRFDDTYNNVIAYDDEGNVFKGNKKTVALGFPSEGLKTWIQTEWTFPKDIPMKFRLQLDGVPEEATKFMLLKLPFSSKGAMRLDYDKPIVIRNLEWAK